MLEMSKDGAGTLGAAWSGLRSSLIALCLISGVINVLALTGSLYMLQVYDRVLSSHSVATLVALSAIAFLMFVFQGVLDVLRSQACGRAASIFDRRIAGAVQRVVLRQPLLGRSRSEAQRPIRDADNIRTFLAGGGPVAFLDLPWMPLYLTFVLLLHPALGALCLGGMVMIVTLTWLTERLSKPHIERAGSADALRRSIADANARNAEPMQAMGFSGRAIQRFEHANQSFLLAQTAAGDIIGTFGGVSKVSRFILQSPILGLGAYLTLRGEVTAGAIIAASITTSRALAPVEQMIAHWRGFLGARQSYQHLATSFAAMPTVERMLTLPPPTQRLTLENISVVVPGTHRVVLHAIGLELKGGQAVAVIGPSAAGKSSLARALTGVWPAVRGAIRLDGAELSRWRPEDLGRHIGYVPQEVTLFEGTIAENICRLEEEADSDAVIAAARAANVHDMILALPDGYETRVGPDGSALSAGQRQRIALARALYGDPFLVVLDEPNSNLDADGELALTGAINAIRSREGIAVVIAHRPSALAAVDQVAMINGGQLTAFGPAEEVLKKVLRQPIRAVAQTVT